MPAALSPAERRVQRCLWLALRLVRDGQTDFRAYHRRFRASSRSYYRDLDVLQRIGISVRSERDHGRVVLLREAL